MSALRYGTAICGCQLDQHAPRLVVVTGGPGAGKTAVLELASRSFCTHVAILPEAASVLFGCGFPRRRSEAGMRAAQRAIFHVQQELESLIIDERQVAVALCDRGTLDGFAYWRGASETYWRALRTSHDRQLARYTAVLQLQPPPAGRGYERNQHRPESAPEALEIDRRIEEIWGRHPSYRRVESAGMFTDKAIEALRHIRSLLPPCCHHHHLAIETTKHSTKGTPS